MRRGANTILGFNWRILTTWCMLLGDLPYLLQRDTHPRGYTGPQRAHNLTEPPSCKSWMAKYHGLARMACLWNLHGRGPHRST